MLITMKRQVFELLDYNVIVQECYEPIIQAYKNKMREKEVMDERAAKLQFYIQLTKGQQALFMFFVYYAHATKSLAEFYWFSNYFLASSTFDEIKAGLRYFADENMLQLLLELEGILRKRHKQGIVKMDEVSYNDVDNNSELMNSISHLHIMFQKTAPFTVKLIGTYIKNNPDEFIQLEE